jgi:hypothetical protein
MRCNSCYGYHDPDPDDSYVDFRGRRFKPPFQCLCCGIVICGRQFAYGRCCGRCDTGACYQLYNRGHNRRDLFEKLGKVIGGEHGSV